jgi:Synergist-CTERM protein sorting domain-containing protein
MNRATTVLVTFGSLLAATRADAHFVLMQPANWADQASDGMPEKTAPCGNEGTPVTTNAVTEFRVGETIDIRIDERVPHPGHYFVSLAPDQASLPNDPKVTPVSGDACGSLPIAASPALPLLADGLLVHTAAFTAPQTTHVTLPAGMLCDHCVLQVVEYMSSHGAPCFYHHCANIKITTSGADAGVPGEAGTSANNGGGGGGCSVGGSPGWLALAVVALVLRRRRVR